MRYPIFLVSLLWLRQTILWELSCLHLLSDNSETRNLNGCARTKYAEPARYRRES